MQRKNIKCAVVGSVHLDVFADIHGDHSVLDKRGDIRVSIGGTAYNIASNLSAMGVQIAFYTVLKNRSLFTRIIMDRVEEHGFNRDGMLLADIKEAGFIAHRLNGDLQGAVTATPIEDNFIDAKRFKESLRNTEFIILDLNNSQKTINSFLRTAKDLGKPIYIMGVSEVKALKLLQIPKELHISGVFFNRVEAKKLLTESGQEADLRNLSNIHDILWIVTKDKDGVELILGGKVILNLPAPRMENVRSFSGAGDAFASGFIFSQHVKKVRSSRKAVQEAFKYVGLTAVNLHANIWGKNILDDSDKVLLRDSLTQIFNRKILEAENRIIESFLYKSSNPVSVALFDIDNFKKINDTYGHDMGDEVLRVFGRLMKDTIRERDIPIRYGGEEFLIIFHNADKNASLRIADRIRSELQKMTIKKDGIKLTTTVSGGVSTFGATSSLESVIKKADKALYEAKHSGKNRICLSP